MRKNDLDCCVVRDLLPSYIEGLTEPETAEMVKSHLEHCDGCHRLADDMATQLPAEKAPEKPLKFLKHVKLTCLFAAIFSAVAALFCIWWLYDQEFHYANNDVGRLQAVYDYIAWGDEYDTHCVTKGTMMRVISWQAEGNELYIFYGADNADNVHGFVHLTRGINGKYRPLDSSEYPSPYSAGVYWNALAKGSDRQAYIALAGENCREIYAAEVHYVGTAADGSDTLRAVRTYPITEPNFMWIFDREKLQREIGFPDGEQVGMYVDEIRLLDRGGNDVTDEYDDVPVDQSWGGGTDTAETFAVYIFMAIAAILGIILVRYFLKED